MVTTNTKNTDATSDVSLASEALQNARELTEKRHQELAEAKSAWLALDTREFDGDDTVTATERMTARDDIDKYTRLLEHAEAAQRKAQSDLNRAVAAESPDLAEILADLIKTHLYDLRLSASTPVLIQPKPLESAPEDITIVLCQTRPTTHDLGWGTCSGRVWVCIYAPSEEELPEFFTPFMKLLGQSPIAADSGNTSPVEPVADGVYKPYRVDVRRAVLETPHLARDVSEMNLNHLPKVMESAIKSLGVVHGVNGQVSHSRVSTLPGVAKLISDVPGEGSTRNRTVTVSAAAKGVDPQQVEARISASDYLGSYFTGLGRCTQTRLINFKPTNIGYRSITVEMTFKYQLAKS